MSKKKPKGPRENPSPIPWPPAEEPIPDMIRRNARYRRARIEFMKRNGITDDTLEEPEEEPEPEVISLQEIDDELDELLG